MKALLSATLALGLATTLLPAETAGLEDISTAPASAQANASEADRLDRAAALQKRARILQEFHADYAYAGDAKLKSAGAASGDLGEQSSHFGYGLIAPIDEKWSIRWGLNMNRLDFERPSGSPLPQNLQVYSTSLGAQYKIDEDWSAFAALSPRLSLMEGFDHINSQEIEIGGALGATWKANKDLTLTFGLAVNPGTEGVPVLPLLGAKWKFAKDWTLNAGMPRTSIDWQVLPNLRFSPILVGFEGGSFHTSKTYGNAYGMPQLNDRKLKYTEVRVGLGAGYAILPNLTADLSGGVIAYRKFEFDDAGYEPKVDPAPYVQIGLRLGF